MSKLNTLLTVFLGALQQLFYAMAAYLPKIIAAILIWYVGKYLLNWGVNLLKKVKVTGTTFDEKAIDFITKTVMVVGKVILVLIVLDYLGIGRTVIGSFMNGLTLAIAIALGLAFGKALETDARELVENAKKHLKK